MLVCCATPILCCAMHRDMCHQNIHFITIANIFITGKSQLTTNLSNISGVLFVLNIFLIFTQLFIQNDHKLEQYGEFLHPPPTTPPCENNYKSVHVDLETRYLSADNSIMHIPTSQLHVRPFYTKVSIFFYLL